MLLGVISAANTAQAGVKMFVRHEVSDYAAWLKSYNEFQTTQRQMGVTAQAVYQSTDNPNDVTVVHDFKSAELAKTFVTSDKLKSAMQGAGVQGAPLILITNSTPGATGKAGKVRMFVHHQVTDYSTWRKSYDAFQIKTASKKGVIAQAVYQAVDDPNDVIAYHDFASLEKAKAFAASDELKAAMQSSGVKSKPDVWFTMRALK
jgi:quinol monooxygenase YgiN